MAHLYEHGYSVDKNMVAAFTCYKKASELGCVKSTTKVGHILYSGIKLHEYDGLMTAEDHYQLT